MKTINVFLTILMLILSPITSKENISEQLRTETKNVIRLREELKLKQDNYAKAESLMKGANMAKECIKSVLETENPDFCWKKGGDAGKVPYGCPQGYFRYLALCYQVCRRHYHFVAGVCWNGGSSYIPSSYTNFSEKATCDAGFYKGGALCYKDCKNIGMENCGIGACSASSSQCGAQIASMALDVITGVGQLALLIASAGTSATTTVAQNQALNQTSRTLERSFKQAAFDKIKKMFSREFFDSLVAKAKKNFVDGIKDLPLDKTVEWYVKNVCEGVWKGMQTNVEKKSEPEDTDMVSIAAKLDMFGGVNIYDKCRDKKNNTGEGCAKAALEFASMFDPTGLLQIAAAFVLPTCNADPISTNTDAWKANIGPKFDCPDCEFTKTNVQDMGKGLQFLDRHNLACESDQLLNFFSFTTDNNSKLRSHYRCIKPTYGVWNCRNNFSNWDHFPKDQDGINFLDRQKVDCRSDYLQKLRFHTNGGDQIRIEYTCCSTHSTPAHTIFSTNKNPLNSWSTHQFNNIDGVDAGVRGAISYFRPRTDGNKFFYEYLTGIVIQGEYSYYHENYTNWQDAGEGSIWFLDRHWVSCHQANSAMTSFRLERNNQTLRFAYRCLVNSRIETWPDTDRFTEYNDVGGDEWKALHFLDRHIVSCPPGRVLKEFGIKREADPGNGLRIQYGCVAVRGLGETITNRTFRTDIGNKNTFYLDRQTYQPLGPDEVLKGFKLESSWNPDVIDFFFQSSSLF
jgi:hypothetical protein